MIDRWRRPLLGFLFIYVAGASVFLATGWSGGSRLPSGAQAESSPDADTKFYKLVFEDFEGTERSFNSFAGRPFVVNFFASWCAPCVEEMPYFQRLHEVRGGTIQIIGLAVEGLRPARNLVQSTGVTYQVGLDKSDLLIEFGGVAMPTTAFVSKDGELLETHSGIITYEDLLSRVNELFDE